MKHVVMSQAWWFDTQPFPAYRCALSFGRTKNAQALLPVKNIAPVTEYTVTTTKEVLYAGTDKVAAKETLQVYETQREERAKADPSTWIPTATLRSSQHPTLPEGEFRVIKTRKRGTILIVPGKDTTNSCLLFIGCDGGFRGDVKVLRGATTGTIIKECTTGNVRDSSIQIAGLFEVGQSIVFHSKGRHFNEVIKFTWNGSEVARNEYSIKEWNTEWELRKASSEEAAEVL